MKNISIIIFTLLLASLQAFAQEKEEVPTSEEMQFEEKEPSFKEKIANLIPQKIRIYEFNPVKNPQGVVTIIEYNDLSCKECLQKSQDFYNSLNSEDLKNVKIIYKHINNDEKKLVNQETIYGFIANKADKFWEYKKEIINNDYKTNEDFISAMMAVGISKAELYDNLMLNSETFYKNVDADNQTTSTIKEKVTPMFFVDGYRAEKDLSIQQINEYIREKSQQHLDAVNKENNKYNMGKF